MHVWTQRKICTSSMTEEITERQSDSQYKLTSEPNYEVGQYGDLWHGLQAALPSISRDEHNIFIIIPEPVPP